MEHQLGHIGIIAWQGRRMRNVYRPNALSVMLAVLISVSTLLLALRFVAGAPLPLGLLQVAFAVLVASGALLLMRALAGLILTLQKS